MMSGLLVPYSGRHDGKMVPTRRRNRALAAMVGTGMRLIELGDLAARVAALKAAAGSREGSSDAAAFPAEPAQ